MDETNNRASRCMKQKLIKLKGGKDKSRNIVGDFNILGQHLKEN